MENTVYDALAKKFTLVGKTLFLSCLTFFLTITAGQAAVTNCYPQDIDYWTGTANNQGVKAQTSLVHAQGPNSSGNRGWMKFDITAIPPGSTINNVVLKFYISSQYNPTYQIRKVTADPVTSSGSTLFSQIGSGTIYGTFSNPTAGQNSRQLSTQARTDLQNALGQGWFAVGFYCTNSSGVFYLWADGWNQANKPYLEITYTTNFTNDIGIDSISSPVNQSCEGQWPVKIKIFNGGINLITSATLNWSINGVSQPSVPWTGTLAPGAITTVTLGNFTFGPGNITIFAQAAFPNGLTDPFPGNNNKTQIVQIIPKPSIYVQPVNQSTGVGGNATFSLLASGGNITYQWQISINNGQTFANLSNAPPYGNVTTNNLIITGATQNMNGYKYRCLVTGICPPSVYSDTVLLSVGPPVRATAVTGYACPGNIAVIPITVKNLLNSTGIKLTLLYNQSNIAYVNYFSVHPQLASSFTVNSSSGTVVIEWASASPVTIADDTICKLRFMYTNNSTIVFDTLVPGNCLFSGGGGLAFPADYVNGAATNGTPSITSHPTSILAIAGIPAIFAVSSLGLPFYQWQISTDNGTFWVNLSNIFPYEGVNDDTLKILSPTLQMSDYQYRCELSGCGTTITSNSATLTVIKLVKTWIDTIYSCPCVSPMQQIVVPIKVASFDSISSISHSIVYKFNALQYVGIQNIHPNLIVSGFVVPNNLDGNPYSVFRLAYYLVQGTVGVPDSSTLYELKFNVKCDTTKIMWETWTPGACQYSTGLTTFFADFKDGYVLDGGPFILQQPSPATVYAGDTATFTCLGATYGASISYQWQESTDGGNTWNNLVPSATYMGVYTPTLKVKATLVTMSGYRYRCRINGLCPFVTTNAVTMTVNSPPIYVTIPPINACAGDTVFVPIVVNNFSQVCSFSLKLRFNGSNLTFAGHKQINPNLPGPGAMMVNNSADTVIMSWTSLVPGTLPSYATLVILKFISNGFFSGSQLIWKTTPAGNCQITNCAAITIASQFNNSTVSVAALPLPYNVITPQPAGGHYCQGDMGVQVGLDNTQLGIVYALYRDGVVVPGYGGVAGTGFGVTFNTFGTPGFYQVLATNPNTGCTRWMDGFVTVIADSPPPLYTVEGGGAYCIGGAGMPVGLSGSTTNVEYMLYKDGFPVDTLSGTGTPLSFGNQTNAGTYTIIARNEWVETCPTQMTGSAVVSITPYPDAAGSISGATTVCQGQTVTYSITQVPNSTSYQWTLPAGATGSSTGTSISVTFTTSAVSGSISVKGINSCGQGTPSNLALTVNPLPTSGGLISGPTTVCQGATGVIYSITAIPEATSYVWTLPTGFTIAANNGNSITVNISTFAMSGNLTVKGNNDCGDGPVSTLAITVSPLPGNAVQIFGNNTPCQGQTVFYSIQAPANATTYSWSLPPGASGSSTTNSISVTYSTSAASGTLSVTPQNSCGNGGTANLPVNVQPLPGTPQAISGPISVCKNTNGVVYTVPSISNALTYIWTYPSGISGTSNSNTITLNFSASASSGNITVKGNNLCGAGPVTVLPITVYNQPTVSQASFPTVCLEGGPYTLTGGNPAGGTYSGPGVSNGILDPTIPGVGTWTITYTYTDGNNCTNSATRSLSINLPPRITGTVSYDNVGSTLMGNVKVYLKNTSNVILDSTLSIVGTGAYAFRCLANAQYNMSATTTRAFPTSSVNSVDALAIAQHSVGMITLPPFNQLAGDVNNSSSLNAGDALLVMRRWVGAVDHFSIPDWLFSIPNPTTISGSDQAVPIKSLAAGDVNASVVPSAAKTEPTVFIEQRGSRYINGNATVEIPVKTGQSILTSAISLALNYPAGSLMIREVKSKLQHFLWNATESQLRIAWYDINPAAFAENETVFTLVVSMEGEPGAGGRTEIQPDAISVMADPMARVFEKVRLYVPSIVYGSDNNISSEGFYLGANHPNPFSSTTEIAYQLPEAGDVKLSLFSLLGNEIKILVQDKQQAGVYKTSFQSGNLAPGMYLYKLELKGKSQLYQQTRSMVIRE
ncbi:MAG TPA: T9SS type A sorting domain-containing protein [Bacteroidales bacterium]|nr:T9SS type A sorting domain-containing protein [Bacteroidales bacterium]HSA43636.1 T9SS type A sorting domain-containing protein [Bacteroidales bacterium]